ncbi:adenylate kinase 9 [Chiloscyllium plagiosum]|uniref:adenylate kinase 9 n=1 Tax=Chiloscyllium plagiosum TaxID=36176 RepID=UPI001CB7FAA4|nr:adenylate kinase 9 [Chiloscyllium plagiosum]
MKTVNVLWGSSESLESGINLYEELTILPFAEETDFCQVVDDEESRKRIKKPLVFADILDEDEVERKVLLSKPTCFLIVGKPSVGKKTLGKSLAQAWNSVLVEPHQLIQENMDANTEIGKQFQECLFRGESIYEELIINLMLDKLRSPEVAHRGYVLCEFPCLSENYLKIPEQIQLIKSIDLKPDFIINIKCPDYDLCERVSGQRQDPVTGNVYQQEQWNPDKGDVDKAKAKPEEEETEEEEESVEELEEAEVSDVDPGLVARLVRRPEDLQTTIEKHVALYKDKMLRLLEDYMADHDRQNMIELDGNNKPHELFASVMYKLEFLGLQPAALVQPLYEEEEEEISEEIDDVSNLFRRNKLLLILPLEAIQQFPDIAVLADQVVTVVSFYIDFAVPQECKGSSISVVHFCSYLDKMYFLSSEETLKKFITNPRPYLLPPQPRPPCKVAILGPKSAGKTTLCKLLAQKYDAKVLDMFELLEPLRQKLKFDHIERIRAEALQSALATVRENLAKTMLEEAQAEFERQAAQAVKLESVTIAEEDEESGDESKDTDAVKYKVQSSDDVPKVPFDIEAVKQQLKIPEVTEDHPDIKEIVNKAVQNAMQDDFQLPMNDYMDTLLKSISEILEEQKVKNPDHLVAGGWVLDNFPETLDQCRVMVELGFAPDNIFMLHNAVDDGKFLLNRLYNLNKDLIEIKMIHRLKEAEEKNKRDREAMLAAGAENPQTEVKGENEADEEMKELAQSKSDVEIYEAQTSAETDQTASDQQTTIKPEPTIELEHSPVSETQIEPEPEITLPVVPEGGYPESPEMDHYRKIVSDYINSFSAIEAVLSTTLYKMLEIAEKTPDALLKEAVEIMEKPFKYYGWELSGADLDEEEEDAEVFTEEAEEEAEEEEEENEEEEEENEDLAQRKNRQMGESKHYCPVALKEKTVLYPGDQDCSAKYREKYYYFSHPTARDEFLKNPEEYVNANEPLKPPPLRLFVFGAKGSGKTINSRWLANKFNIFHIQFVECLQELLFPKTKKKIGPEYDDEPTEEELVEIATIAALEKGEPAENIEIENEKPEEEEVEYTAEEEAMKAYLLEDEQLPSEILDNLIPKWWNEEPFKSTGFVLDGFPTTSEEVQYLIKNSLFPDASIFIKVEESNVIDWILPSKLEKWREKRRQKLKRKNKIKELKKKIKDEKIEKRRQELLAERAEKKKENEAYTFEQASNESEATDEEDEENIEEILADEFSVGEEEEDEEDEEEEDAIERMKTEIGEKYEADHDRIEILRDQLRESLIPCIVIDGKRKPHIVRYKLNQKVEPLVINRDSLFEKCFPVNIRLVRKILANSYKLLSSFGLWDVVELSKGTSIQPILDMYQNVFPVIHRKYVYYFVTKENRNKFMANPFKYISQTKPRPVIPIKIAILGPPKSGKSTVARRFVSEFGVLRISAGEAVRTILATQKKTELAIHILKHLQKGLVVPDEFVIKCIELKLMDVICNTRGFVLDGYPVTKQQINLMNNCKIIPVKIIELQADIKEILKRGLIDSKSPDRTYPLHDSSQILTVRNSSYTHEISAIWKYYQVEHQNWHIIYALHSKWWVWEKVLEIVKSSVKQIELYLERIQEGKAACIIGLCITPKELKSRFGAFQQYCPVSLQLHGELVDCSIDPSLEFAAEFRGYYYKMASKEALDMFLDSPEAFVPPIASKSLPTSEMLPKRLTAAGVKARFPKQAEFMGYCPVTFVDGKLRYEALIPGVIDNAAEYRNRIYLFQDEEQLEKFMRLPDKYWDLILPNKLPPVKDPVLPTSLPMLGYMEQGAALSIIKALTAVGCLKPKYPFLSVKKSALLYVFYHLKAYNPNSFDYVKKKYRKKLEQYEEHCELIRYLGSKMTRKYKEPKDRPIDFDHKLQKFLSLKNLDPTVTGVP